MVTQVSQHTLLSTRLVQIKHGNQATLLLHHLLQSLDSLLSALTTSESSQLMHLELDQHLQTVQYLPHSMEFQMYLLNLLSLKLQAQLQLWSHGQHLQIMEPQFHSTHFNFSRLTTRLMLQLTQCVLNIPMDLQ